MQQSENTMATQISWRVYVMVICGLIAVFLDALAPQMLVPIIPIWLGWCDDKVVQTTVALNYTNITDVVTTVAFTDTTMTTSTNQAIPSETWTRTSDEVAHSSLNKTTQYEINQTQVGDMTTSVSLDDVDKTCTVKDFDPRISLAYLAAGPVEVFLSPPVAKACDYLGSSSPLLFGIVATAIINIPLAYGSGFLAYLLLRVVINIATTITEVSYMHMVGEVFVEDEVKRSRFLGLYSTLLGFDYFGPTFFGVLYHFSDQAVPFLTLLAVGLVTALVFFIFGLKCRFSRTINLGNRPGDVQVRTGDIPYLSLIKDPYVIIVFVANFLIIVPKPIVAPFISLWLIDNFDASEWMTGIVYFPGFLAYIFSSIVAERLVSKFEKHSWKFGAVFLTLDGLCVIAMPFSPSIKWFTTIFTIQIATATFAGFIMFPMFLKIAVKRYDRPKSSSIHGVAFIAVGLAYFLGPMVASVLFVPIGFTFINLGVGLLHLLIAPFIIMLRNLNGDSCRVHLPQNTDMNIPETDPTKLELCDQGKNTDMNIPETDPTQLELCDQGKNTDMNIPETDPTQLKLIDQGSDQGITLDESFSVQG